MIQRACNCQKQLITSLGGLIKHAYNFTAVTNPTVNSYKRLVPDCKHLFISLGLAATVHHWSGVPASRYGNSFGIALSRPMANPYVALAVLLEVGFHGIESKIEAPAPIEENIYVMTPEERKEAGITDLPSTPSQCFESFD